MKMQKQILTMAILAVLVGLGSRTLQKEPLSYWGFPKPIELIQPKVAMAGADAKVSPDSAFTAADNPYEVDMSTAMGLYAKRKKENIHFVDAREVDQYLEGHITGALNVPVGDLGKYEDRFRALPKEDLVVIYCDGGDCHLSHELADWALQEGWKRVAVYKGGWDEWSVESDFIETGEAKQ